MQTCSTKVKVPFDAICYEVIRSDFNISYYLEQISYYRDTIKIYNIVENPNVENCEIDLPYRNIISSMYFKKNIDINDIKKIIPEVGSYNDLNQLFHMVLSTIAIKNFINKQMIFFLRSLIHLGIDIFTLNYFKIDEETIFKKISPIKAPNYNGTDSRAELVTPTSLQTIDNIFTSDGGLECFRNNTPTSEIPFPLCNSGMSFFDRSIQLESSNKIYKSEGTSLFQNCSTPPLESPLLEKSKYQLTPDCSQTKVDPNELSPPRRPVTSSNVNTPEKKKQTTFDRYKEGYHNEKEKYAVLRREVDLMKEYHEKEKEYHQKEKESLLDQIKKLEETNKVLLEKIFTLKN